MQLKYVGDMPIVSKKGVGFDKTQPDKYNYLYAAVELLEALSYGPTETTQHLYQTKDKSISSDELLSLIQKHVSDLDKLFEESDKKAHDFVHSLVDRINENDTLTKDEKTAWLENVKLMRAYFYQYVINRSAYEAALNALSDEIHAGQVKEVIAPMFKNYAMVLNDLTEVLERRKSPIDSTTEVVTVKDELHFKVTFSHR